MDKKKLVVEIDGDYHLSTKEYDKKRENYIKNSWGFHIFRLKNKDVYNNNYKDFLEFYESLPFVDEPIKSKRLGKGHF